MAHWSWAHGLRRTPTRVVQRSAGQGSALQVQTEEGTRKSFLIKSWDAFVFSGGPNADVPHAAQAGLEVSAAKTRLRAPRVCRQQGPDCTFGLFRDQTCQARNFQPFWALCQGSGVGRPAAQRADTHGPPLWTTKCSTLRHRTVFFNISLTTTHGNARARLSQALGVRAQGPRLAHGWAGGTTFRGRFCETLALRLGAAPARGTAGPSEDDGQMPFKKTKSWLLQG